MSSGQIVIDRNTYLQLHSEFRTLGSHSYRCRQGKAKNNIYFSFFIRTIRLRNKLHAEIAESNSLADFNSKLLPNLAKNQ